MHHIEKRIMISRISRLQSKGVKTAGRAPYLPDNMNLYHHLQREEPTMKKECVILADSHLIMLEGLRGLLESMFEAVIMVADRDSLCKSLVRIKPDFMVLDLSLAGATCGNIVREARELHPELKLIVLSVHEEENIAAGIIKDGASGYVLKRSVANDLIPAIDSISDGRVFISPSLCR